MEQSLDSSQFVPGSLMSLRRTSTGSLSSLKKQESHLCLDSSSPSPFRHNPIAGSSWDDNSVGHGTVAARMRRERNRAIQQTLPYSSHSFNTHAHITSTLNLINTTALSPWRQHDLSPWDYDMTSDLSRNTVASKRSAGSLFNIPSSDAPPAWDARSIPDYVRARPPKRISYRHSYTSAYHHSSPTSGCASMAGSDIDSSDLAFFSMTDDSSLFDTDSLFSDSYGVLETDSGFSTNIYNLLAEGSISCRTPFLNADWTDSHIGPTVLDSHNVDVVSKEVGIKTTEIARNTSEVRTSDISCVHSRKSLDIDTSSPACPSSSLLIKADIDVKSFLQTNDLTPNHKMNLRQETQLKQQNINGMLSDGTPSSPMQLEELALQEEKTVVDCLELSMRSPQVHQGPEPVVTWTPGKIISRISSVKERGLKSAQTCQEKVPRVTAMQEERPPVLTPHNRSKESEVAAQVPLSGVVGAASSLMGVSGTCAEQFYNQQSKVPLTAAAVSRQISRVPLENECGSLEQTLALNLSEWNNLPLSMKLGLVEQLSDKISKTMSLQEQLDIIHILGANDDIPFHMSIDDIDSHKLIRVLGYLDTHRCVPSSSSASPSDGGLRRSNSDGNIAKSASDSQKEHRRRQRQARRFAKWLKQRQRKENRQQLKEQRSGLFVNEEKVKLEVSAEEVEVDV